MALLSVSFKPNTNHHWVSQVFTQLGLTESLQGIRCNNQFQLFAHMTGFYALVQVADGDEIAITRSIILISPQIDKVERA